MKSGAHSAHPSPLLMPAFLLVGGLTLIVLLLFSGRVIRVTAAQDAGRLLDPAAVAAGKQTFMSVCATCHSPTARGIKGLGKPLIDSAFFNHRTDAEMLAFLQVGRPLNDPLNTTGVTMPARGGRLTLTDADLLNVIAYIRSLNGVPVAAGGDKPSG